jgi:hypothetical protein
MPEKPPGPQDTGVSADSKLVIGRKRGKSLSNTPPPKSNEPATADMKRGHDHLYKLVLVNLLIGF